MLIFKQLPDLDLLNSNFSNSTSPSRILSSARTTLSSIIRTSRAKINVNVDPRTLTFIKIQVYL